MTLISKYDLIEKIVATTDETLLQQIKHLLEEEEVEDWDKLPNELKKGLQKGLSQAKSGKLSSHSKAIKEIRKKYLKQ